MMSNWNITRCTCFKVTRGPLVLYCSPECWGYVELEQTWKYINTQCCVSFHPCRSIRKQIWPCHKNSQGQPKIIIWNIGSTLVPHAVYQVSKSSASWFWRKIFLKFFTIIYMGMVMWPETFEQIFIPTSHGGSIWHLASIGLVVSE